MTANALSPPPVSELPPLTDASKQSIISHNAIVSSYESFDKAHSSLLTEELERALPSPTSTLVATSATQQAWQALPPLLSRLPPALLASPHSLPVPVSQSELAHVVASSSAHKTDASLGLSSSPDESSLTAPALSRTSSSSSSASISSSASDYASHAAAFSHVGYTNSHLPSIDPASLALHYELYKLRVRDVEHYANARYEEAFNWGELELPIELEREWYIVAFRSVRRKGADTDALYAADRAAHEEAVTAGGLLLYWYGAPNDAGENLATCIWQSRKDALLANRNPKHAIAARLAASTYETYKLERYILRKSAGTLGLQVEEWQGGDVGF